MDPRPSSAPSETASCPACGGGAGRPWLRRAEWRYVRCGDCGHAWLDPKPPSAFLDEVYDRPYFAEGRFDGYFDYAADEALHRRNARARLELIRRHGQPPPGVLVELGPALGFFLEEAWLAGYETYGVERSAWARAQALERAPGRVVGTWSELPAALEGRCSVVALFQVLAHLEDPARDLAEARRLLAPGGLLVIETWNAESRIARLFGRRWQQISPPSVLHLFGRRSLHRLLVRAGFETTSYRSATKRVSLSFATGLAASKLGLAGLGRRLGRSPLAKIAVPYRLGDLVAVTARPAGVRRGGSSMR